MTEVKWHFSEELIEYGKAMTEMEQLVSEIIHGNSTETIWVLEHQDVYTAGTSAKQHELLEASKFPVYQTGRGGKFTYHGPGQKIIYPFLNLNLDGRKRDVRLYVATLENWVMDILSHFGLKPFTIDDKIGIWLDTEHGYKKIAAIGIRVKKWVTFHGISINHDPDLKNFEGIVPCGISEYGVTSLKQQGINISKSELNRVIQQKFYNHFN
jgi:lipoyl(octanoyl) transferase